MRACGRLAWPVLALAVTTGVLLTLGCAAKASFAGTEFTPPKPAAPFSLYDQFGHKIALADYKGRIVVLVFIYTNCTDVCPLITQAMNNALGALGEDAAKTAFVAITVDPARDTVEQVYQYSEQKGMLHKWAFLTGSQDELAPVWQAYYIATELQVAPVGGSGQEQYDNGTSSQAVGGETPVPGSSEGYQLEHSAPVYLIDGKSRLRVVFTELSLDAQPLVHDIRLLLR